MRKLGLFLLFTLLVLGVRAQVDLSTLPLPIDSTFITGELENGMKYYIRENHKPAGLADFYIARSVGAVEEDDNQDGLAHFLEHMAFNGTENLPGKAMLNYLQSIGAEFGRNINAWTSKEETVYMLNDIPITRQAVVDSSLLILFEWSQNVSLLKEEVDKERGVIIEELRGGNTASRRMFDKSAPYIFNGTKYKDRSVIGTEQGLKSFKQEDIVSFYDEWYRPEYQAIIVVGDFDAEKMESEIKEIFSKVVPPENVRDKHREVIPDFEENKFVVLTDPENTSTYIQYVVPVKEIKPEQKKFYLSYFESSLTSIISSIFSERMSEILQSKNPPFLAADLALFPLTTTTDVMYGYVAVKDGEAAKGLEALIAQKEKLRNHGVTQDELDRAILKLKTAAEAAVKHKEDKKSKDHVRIALDNFLSGDPIISEDQNMLLVEQFTSIADLNMVNSYIQHIYPDKKGAIIAISPDKEGVVPTVEQLSTAFDAGMSANLDAPVEVDVVESLINDPIKKGSIVKESKDLFGNIVWKLSNGATMILRPTDLKQDQVLLSGSGFGGRSYLPEEYLLDNNISISLAANSGLGDLSAQQLKRFMVGKRGSANVSATSTRSEVSGASSAKMSDVEVMMQQLYLRFMAPRFDTVMFDNIINQYENFFANYDKDPSNKFSDKIEQTLYGEDNERLITNLQLKHSLHKIDIREVEAAYREQFNGVNGFKFYMVGKFDVDSIRSLVEEYIASLPAGKIRKMRDEKLDFIAKKEDVDFFAKMENPQSSVAVLYTGSGVDYSLENRLKLSLLSEILRLRYTEIIREEKGATYGVGVSSSLEREPKEEFILSAFFDTNEDVASEMADIIHEEIEKIAKGEVLDDDFSKVVSARKKNYDVDQKENGKWLAWIEEYYKSGENYPEEYIDTLNSITKDDIVQIANELLKKSYRKKIIMSPEK